MAALWIVLGIAGGLAAACVIAVTLAIRGAELGLDPFASLPCWDEDTDSELARLLEDA